MPTELTVGGRAVLDAILGAGPDRALSIANRRRIETPRAADMYALCNLLACDPPEQRLQTLLEERPGFIGGLLGGPDNSDMAMLFEPRIGTRYVADFALLQAHQGGAQIHLVEIESAHEPLFTKAGGTAKRLAAAMKQIEDWMMEINRHRLHYAKDLVRMACACDAYDNPVRSTRGFRMYDPEQLNGIWEGFGGATDPAFSYTIIIGRWSKLTRDEKARVMNRNRDPNRTVRIFTYEQVARGANFRLERDEWYNEYDDIV